jgi:hypothetical protein
MKETRRPIEAYEETVGVRKALIKAAGPAFPGYPRRIAAAEVMVSELDESPLHLLLEHDVYNAYREKLTGLTESLSEWESVTLDVNFSPE